jgi:hypothetical protein
METENRDWVICSHCGARVLAEDAVHCNGALMQGEHYHCRNCDPDGTWDCLSDELDCDLH